MNFLKKRDFATSPYRSERSEPLRIKHWNVKRFLKLLDTLESFLKSDKCYRLADNYLIAMVLTYFLRASLEPDEYTQMNFFAALSLAYCMEEDDNEFMLTKLDIWLDCTITDLKRVRDELFQRMDYRGTVSRTCCDIVMRATNPEHKVWQRRRHIYHSGIVSKKTWQPDRDATICPMCNGDDSDSDSEEEVDY